MDSMKLYIFLYSRRKQGDVSVKPKYSAIHATIEMIKVQICFVEKEENVFYFSFEFNSFATSATLFLFAR